MNYIKPSQYVNKVSLVDEPIVQKSAKLKPGEVRNDTFLKGIFGHVWENAHVTGFEDPPDSGLSDTDADSNAMSRRRWGGSAYGKWGRRILKTPRLKNTFYTVSTFFPDQEGKSRRRKSLHLASYVIVIDDVGTGKGAKVEPDKLVLEPSYLLETSKDNFQAGYLLSEPVENGGIFSGVLDALVVQGISADGKDPGMKGVTRYVRLPIGINNKEKYDEDFEVKLHTWNPLRRYGLKDFCAAWNVDLEKVEYRAKRKKRDEKKVVSGDVTQMILDEDDPILDELNEQGKIIEDYGDGKYEIHCPFEDEHSIGGGGTAYFRWGTGGYPFGGFKCHHGHCEQRSSSEFWEKIMADSDDRIDWGSLRIRGWMEFTDLTAEDVEVVEDTVIDENSLQADSILDDVDMLRRFVFIEKKSRIIDLTKSPKDEPYEYQEFINAYAPHTTDVPVNTPNGQTRIEKKKSTLLWSNSPDRMTAKDIVYSPGEARILKQEADFFINTFCFPNHPESNNPEAVEKIKKHILYLCGNNEDDYYELLMWIAHKIQNPHQRSMKTPLLMSEGHGTGKSFFGKLLRRLFGDWNVSPAKMKDLMSGDFNGFLVNKLLVIIDEVRDNGDRQPWAVNDRLRDTLTEEHLLINSKHGSQGSQRIYANFLMMSNHPNDALKISRSDRRIHAIDNPLPALGEEYYIDLHRILRDDACIGAIFHHFKNFPLGAYNHASPALKNHARSRLVNMSITGASELVADLISDMEVPDIVSISHIEKYAHASFVEGVSAKLGMKEIQAALRDMNCFCYGGQIRYKNGKRARPWCIRNLSRWKSATQDEIKSHLIRCDEYFTTTEFTD
jgi:hypothetical protein